MSYFCLYYTTFPPACKGRGRDGRKKTARSFSARSVHGCHGRDAAHPERSGFPQDFPDAVRGETVFLRQIRRPRAFRVFPADRPVALVQLGPRAASRSPSGPSVGPGNVDGAALEILPDFVQQFFGKNLFRVDVMDSEPPFLLPRVRLPSRDQFPGGPASSNAKRSLIERFQTQTAGRGLSGKSLRL